MLGPFEAVAERFKEQYKTFAAALDTTRHELHVRSVHLDGDGPRFLGRKQASARRGAGGTAGACQHLCSWHLIPMCHPHKPPLRSMGRPPSNGRGHRGPARRGLFRVQTGIGIQVYGFPIDFPPRWKALLASGLRSPVLESGLHYTRMPCWLGQ